MEEKYNKNITCKETHSLQRTLIDPDFIFRLTLLHKIIPHVDTLFNKFQTNNKDTTLGF